MIAHATTCRSCGGGALIDVLDLGDTPLANALLTPEQLKQPERRYPLKVAFCADCSLVQITHTVPPEELFSEYLYLSSFSDTMQRHAKALVEELIEKRGLSGQSLAVEIASNDGYLLRHYRERGVLVLGIEPAKNIATIARDKGIETLCAFFTAELAALLKKEGVAADVVHAHNVLAHVADLNGFVEGIATILKPGGVAVIEAPYVRDMIEHREFDTIYHEHLCYFSLTALDALFTRHGLNIVNAKRVPIHGGSLRITAAPLLRGAAVRSSPSVAAMLDEERSLGMTSPDFYCDFGRTVKSLKKDLRDMLGKLKAAGHTIAVYGASAKGSTLLNYCGLGEETFDFVADRSTVKQGRYTPGTHLPIVPAEQLAKEKPDYTLLLTWNFRDEILAQQKAYRDAGGRFIIPIPNLEVV